MIWFSGLLAVLGGSLFPIQTAINAQLGRLVGGALIATIISFMVGLVALGLAWLALSRQWPDAGVLRAIPPHLLVGGLLGASFLGLSVFIVPRLGSGTTMCLVIAGQIVMSMAIDRLGLFGLVARDLSPWRLIGAALIAAGVLIVRFY